jgi:D-beta-D-heptose 7-phosphate kinase/D-beta-D-heptose 1-phosphate adenosyltransferase
MDLQLTTSEASYDSAEAALDQVSARAAGARVVVIGDVMLDEFVFGAVQRISPEAPVPVVEITGRRYAAGGAANVAANVAALGAQAVLGGVTGQDEASENLHRLLAAMRLDSWIGLSDAARPTICKTRIVAGGQQIVRIDHESRGALCEASESRLISAAVAALREAQACVISDYGKGVVSPRMVAALVAECDRRSVPVLVDPKGHDYSKYAGVTLITPNLKEAEMAAAHPIANQRDMILAAGRIMDTAGCASLLITQGASGMTLFRRGQAALHSAALAHQVFDVTGAGDTAVAMLALALATGLTMEDAMLLANVAAGIVVEKPGTATVSLDEMAELMRNGFHRRAR